MWGTALKVAHIVSSITHIVSVKEVIELPCATRRPGSVNPRKETASGGSLKNVLCILFSLTLIA